MKHVVFIEKVTPQKKEAVVTASAPTALIKKLLERGYRLTYTLEPIRR